MLSALLAVGCAVFVVTAVDTAAGLTCYDCNSNVAANGSGTPAYNIHCGTDGTINAEYNTPVTCNTYCFSRVDRRPAGVVFRGCLDGFYLPEEARQVGCVEGGPTDPYLCLCDQDNCNTEDLSAISLQYVGAAPAGPTK